MTEAVADGEDVGVDGLAVLGREDGEAEDGDADGKVEEIERGQTWEKQSRNSLEWSV